jgi:RNA polymerase sigma-70 factor (ECF subfamily)
VNAGPTEQAHYEELYRTHYARVRRLCCLLLADSGEAEDVAQEVFLKLFRAYQAQHHPMAWEAWLTRVAVNACRDRRRSGWWKWWRVRRDVSWGEALSEEPCVHDIFLATDLRNQRLTPEEEVISREARGRIWQAFGKLSRRQQEVFVLRYLEGWSIAEVAKALELTVGSVKRHLFRAVCHLRSALGDHS